MRRQASKRTESEQPKTRYVAIFVVVVATLAVVGNLVLSLNFTPEKTTARAMEKIARDYYENYFYDNYVGDRSREEIEEELSGMKESGFPRTYLHDLLLFDNERHAEDAKEFRHKGYTCDTNKTYVIFYPKEPYGKKDYDVKYEMVCEYVGL